MAAHAVAWSLPEEPDMQPVARAAQCRGQAYACPSRGRTRGEVGQSIAEYALLAAFLAVVVVAIVIAAGPFLRSVV
jgi:hypothetical protein